MTRAIIQAWHKYTPFGGEFYEPIFDFQMKTLAKYSHEFEKLYIADSNWDADLKNYPYTSEVIEVDPSLRYYDAYKEVLPQIKEDLVLFMDNDMIVYKPFQISNTFAFLENLWQKNPPETSFDVVSIYDTIGTMKVNLPDGKNKFCPYWFSTRKDLLMKYLNVDWSPDAMPYTETFGLLTEAMLKDGVRPYEWPEDKGDVDFSNGIKTEKDTGTYHIRSGSVPAYLLATKHYGDRKTYDDYLKNQPHKEILRHCDWYRFMGGDSREIEFDLRKIENFVE